MGKRGEREKENQDRSCCVLCLSKLASWRLCPALLITQTLPWWGVADRRTEVWACGPSGRLPTLDGCCSAVCVCVGVHTRSGLCLF